MYFMMYTMGGGGGGRGTVFPSLSRELSSVN